MRYDLISRFSLVLALAGAMAASPALAQGKGKGQDKKDKSRPELVRRESQKRQAEIQREAQKRRAESAREAEKRRAEYLREMRKRGDDDRRYDRRDDDRRYGGRDNAPPFCRNGKGHPVHGRQWCRDKGYGLGGNDGWYGDRDRRYDDLHRDRRGANDRYGDYGRYGSYDQAHRAFHADHDRQCRMRAAERPLDIQWQVRVRSECKQRHDDWHLRAGQRHG